MVHILELIVPPACGVFLVLLIIWMVTDRESGYGKCKVIDNYEAMRLARLEEEKRAKHKTVSEPMGARQPEADDKNSQE